MMNVDNFMFKIDLFNIHQSLMSSLLMNFMYTFSTFLFYWSLFIKL
jgi:hypothetical protein